MELIFQKNINIHDSFKSTINKIYRVFVYLYVFFFLFCNWTQITYRNQNEVWTEIHSSRVLHQKTPLWNHDEFQRIFLSSADVQELEEWLDEVQFLLEQNLEENLQLTTWSIINNQLACIEHLKIIKYQHFLPWSLSHQRPWYISWLWMLCTLSFYLPSMYLASETIGTEKL